MNEDFNPNSHPRDAEAASAYRLSQALEHLTQDRLGATGPLTEAHAVISNGRKDLLLGGGSGPCPDPSDLALLLSSQLHPQHRAEAEAMLAHVAGCSMCAEALRDTLEEVTPEEAEILATLNCQSAAGQRRMAADLAQTPRSSRLGSLPRLYLWGGAGLAASLLIAIGLAAWSRAANNPEHLLAQAYADDRLFQLRMPGAAFADVKPPRHLRGQSTAHELQKLLEAKAGIQRKLAAEPHDPHELQLEARLDILQENFDPAIEILDRLLAAGPITPSLLLDDASAHFQRGVATGSEQDRAAALDSLRRADELAPDNRVVLFNEALVMEDRGQLINAVETWNRYLSFERDPEWQAEGRRRLQLVEQKLNDLNLHVNAR